MAMKQTDELKEQVAGVTECPICTEKLNNNRLLPCGHTFCLKCLELYKKQANPKGKSLPCPICRREFGIPKGGCSSLTKNFALEQLIGAQRPAKNNDLAQCDVCDLDRRMAAILFCIQCEQNLCADCERTHKKMKSTSMHHVVPISKKNHMRHSMSKNYCEHHVDQGLELVCSDCNEAICWKCKSLTHQSHNCVEINEAADQCIEQLKTDFEETENRILMLGKLSASIQDKSRQQQDHLDQERSNIAKISADMIRTIVANEEKLVKQLEAYRTRNMEALQPKEERVCGQLDDLKQHNISIKQILDCGQPWRIYRSTTALHDKTTDLLKYNKIDVEDVRSSNMSDIQIREQLSGIKPIVQVNSDEDGYVNSLQSMQQTCVEAKKKPEETSVSVNSDEGAYANCPQSEQQICIEPTPPKKKPECFFLPGTPKRKSTSDWSNTSTVGKITGNGKAINGVTILKQKVYTIYENSPQIQVYDSNTLNWLSEFKLDDLHEPKHLTSCGLNNCLYLAGLKNQIVYKVGGTGNAVLLKWNSEEDAHCLSTTKDGTVILAGFFTQTLKEHNTRGTLLRTIILKPDLSIAINPWHALKLESGNYLICHGQSRTSKHRVCMISPDGDVIKSFGDEKGSEMNGLFGPYHLALDENGNVLVVDCNNSRIVVLSPALQYLAEIKTELRCPVRLCFDSESGSLYVADNELRTGKRTDGQIVVLGLQPKH